MSLRRVLVTGATGGMGGALITALLTDPANSGIEIHALCRDTSRFTLEDPRVVVHECDLDDVASIEALEIPADIDAVVHAAALGANLLDEETGPEQWQAYLAGNVIGAATLTKRCRDNMTAGSTVVFINSGLGLKASPTSVPYSAAKAALKSYADSIRPEYNRRGIRVTTLYPGQTATEMLKHNAAVSGYPWEPERYIQPEQFAALTIDLLKAGPSLQLTDVSVRPAIEPW